MDRTEEHVLAWALVDSARAFVTGDEHVRLCTAVGAGELDSAIVTAVRCHLTADRAMPEGLVDELNRWAAGYIGSGREFALMSLIGRVRVHFAPAVARVANDTAAQRIPVALRVVRQFTKRRSTRSSVAEQNGRRPGLSTR